MAQRFGVAQRDAQVVVLRLERVERSLRVRAIEHRLCTFCKRSEPEQVALSPGCFARAFVKPGLRVLPHRFQQAEAMAALAVLELHHAFASQRCEGIQHRPFIEAFARTNSLSSLEREAACEHGKARVERLFVLREQGMAPVDRRAQRLVATGRVRVAAGQETEAMIQPIKDLLDRHDCDARGRQFQGQRNAVEPHAKPGKGCRLRWVQPELGSSVLCPLDEQADCRDRLDAIVPAVRVGQGQRWQRVAKFTLEAESLAARGQQRGRMRAAQPHRSKFATCVQQVFAVVEDKEQALRGSLCAYRVNERFARALSNIEYARHGPHDRLGAGLRREVDEPDAVDIGLGAAPRDLAGEPCLAHASGAKHADDSRSTQQGADLHELVLATNE